MEMNDKEIFQLIYPRVNASLIKGYYKGGTSPENDKLYGLTYVPVVASALEHIESLQYLVDGYAGWNADPERLKKYVSAHSYQRKSLKECLEEGVYSAYSVSFYGAVYQGAWHITPSLLFFGAAVTETQAREYLDQQHEKNQLFNSDLFGPQRLSHFQSADLKEFSEAPVVVAMSLQRRKEKVNAAFRHYVEEAIFPDLVTKLRLYYPHLYDSLTGLYTNYFTNIFPAHKRYLLLITNAMGINKKEHVLRYLVYMMDNGQVYEWNYFQPQQTSGFYGEDIIKQLGTISSWKEIGCLHSSCTLDDPLFWENFVFVKENGGYRYLRELTFPLDAVK